MPTASAAPLPLVSLIIPAYNEEGNLPLVYERVTAVETLLAGRCRLEMIILDNCSTDRTRELALEFCHRSPRWKYLRYSRNFGAEASLLAGLDHAGGDAVITLFSDLQDPPEMIPRMIEIWSQGAEVVYGIVEERNDSSLLKTLGAKIGYRMINTLTDCKIPINATDFRLLDQRVVQTLRTLREPDRFMRGLVHWVGYRRESFLYNRAERMHGKTNANLIYCVKLTLHAIVCFSAKPMHFAVIFGLVTTFLAGLLSCTYVVLYFVRPAFLTPPPPGLTTLLLISLLTLGLNSLFLGIIGEYVGRIYNQGKGRPIYIVAEKRNLSGEAPAA